MRRLGLSKNSKLRVIVDEESRRIIVEPVDESENAEKYYGIFKVVKWPSKEVDDLISDSVFEEQQID